MNEHENALYCGDDCYSKSSSQEAMNPPVHPLHSKLRFQSILAWCLVVGGMLGFSAVRMSSPALAGYSLLCFIGGLALLMITKIQIGWEPPHTRMAILGRIISAFAVTVLLIGLWMTLNGIILFGTMLVLPSAALLFLSKARKNPRKQTGTTSPESREA